MKTGKHRVNAKLYGIYTKTEGLNKSIILRFAKNGDDFTGYLIRSTSNESLFSYGDNWLRSFTIPYTGNFSSKEVRELRRIIADLAPELRTIIEERIAEAPGHAFQTNKTKVRIDDYLFDMEDVQEIKFREDNFELYFYDKRNRTVDLYSSKIKEQIIDLYMKEKKPTKAYIKDK